MVELPPQWMYWLGSSVLLIANVGCWVATFFMLPGNWGMVALAALFALLFPEQENGLGMSWWAVAALLVLALFGEIIELVAGAAGAARLGASRRAVALSMLGAMVGSIVGAIIGVPVPLIGPLIAALGGAALGAFAGAYFGEAWKGRTEHERVSISKAAVVGRLLGTLGKLFTGMVMVVYATIESLWV